MKAFPMFIRTTGRRVVIVGGGEQAAQKARLLLKTDATLMLVADTLEDELEGLVAAGHRRVVEDRARHRSAMLLRAALRHQRLQLRIKLWRDQDNLGIGLEH
ncbi:MAG: NAD(P)-dependent oxidoreductase, partial [Pseudomonadota bacterium]